MNMTGMAIPCVSKGVGVIRWGDGRVHTVCFRGENIAFYTGGCKVEGGDSPDVDTVEVRYVSEASRETRAEGGRAFEGKG